MSYLSSLFDKLGSSKQGYSFFVMTFCLVFFKFYVFVRTTLSYLPYQNCSDIHYSLKNSNNTGFKNICYWTRCSIICRALDMHEIVSSQPNKQDTQLREPKQGKFASVWLIVIKIERCFQIFYIEIQLNISGLSTPIIVKIINNQKAFKTYSRIIFYGYR